MNFQPVHKSKDTLQVDEKKNQPFQSEVLHYMAYDKEDHKDSSILEEKHVNMHEVTLQPIHIIVKDQEGYDDENFLDELHKLCLSTCTKNLFHHKKMMSCNKNKWRTMPYQQL